MKAIKNNEYVDISKDDLSEMERKKFVYEVIRVINGVPLFLEDHILRLNNSLKLIKEEKLLANKIKMAINKLILNSNSYYGNIKVLYDFIERDVYIYFIPHFYPEKDVYENGVKTILYFGERNNPNAKIMDITFREKVNKKIKDNNAYEAILVNNMGYITEGSKSNIFLVKEDKVITPPNNRVLPGITRQKIYNLCENNKIELIEMDIYLVMDHKKYSLLRYLH